MAELDPQKVSFNIFSETTKDNIKVGYISTDRGFVDGLSVLEANRYASENPGTQFIFRNRDKIKYLNINEVNNLKVDDLTPARSASNNQCKPVIGLRERDLQDALGTSPLTGLTGGTGTGGGTNPNAGIVRDVDVIPSPEVTFLPPEEGGGRIVKRIVNTSSGPVVIKTSDPNLDVDDLEKYAIRLNIAGGGGVGARANPIIGKDGSLLAVHVVAGGFGYQYAPQVNILDDDDIGKGATAKAFIGEVIEVETESFDAEEDFEEYETDGVAFGGSSLSWGRRFDVNGKDIGEWNPSSYLRPERNPIAREIEKYQRFLANLTNPWWDTRKEAPIQVTAKDRKDRVIYKVQHHAWGGERNDSKDLVSVEFEVYSQGTKGNRSINYEFTAQDGSHKFTVKGITGNDNNSRKTDTIKVKTNTTYDVKASVLKGSGARSEVVEQGLLENPGRKAKENRKFQETKNSATIFGDIVGSLNDNDDIQITAKKGKFKASNRRTVSVNPSDELKEKYKDQPHRFKRATFDLTYRLSGSDARTTEIRPSFMNKYAVSPVPPSNAPGSDFAGINYTMEWEENFPYTGDYIFRGAADNTGKLYIDNEFVMDTEGFRSNPKKNPKKVEAGVHKIRLDLYNTPQFETKTIAVPTQEAGTNLVPVDIEVYGQGSKRNMALMFVFSEIGGKHTFTVNNVERSGTVKKQSIKVKANTQYKVTAVSTGTISTNAGREEKRYPIKLAAPGEKGGGRRAKIGKVERKKIKYLDEHGDDPNAQLSIDSSSPGVDAKFSGDGSELIVKGRGNVSLKFKWDDDPSSAGLAVGELKVGGKTFRQKGKKGEVVSTINVGGNSNIGMRRKNITKSVPIRFNNLNPSNNPIEVSGNNRRNKNNALKLKDGSGNDINAKIIIEDVKGGTAQFSDDGKSLVCTGSVEVRIAFEVDDDPKIAGVALQSFSIANRTWSFRGGRGETDTVQIDATEPVRTELKLVPEQGTLKKGAFKKGRKGIESSRVSDVIFADIIGSANDNDDMQIKVAEGNFTPSNKRHKSGVSGQGKQRRNTWDLTYILNKDVPPRTGGESSGGITDKEIFNTLDYINKADRKLWRINPRANRDADFANRYGVLPFNPAAGPKTDGKKKPAIVPPKKPSVRFVREGGELFLKVNGEGKVKVGFKLRTDDNQFISGVFAEEIKISADGPDVLLKRTKIKKFNASGKSRFQGREKYSNRIKEKERIKGSGIFTAGRKYRVKVIGGSSTSGFKPIDKTTIGFDDDISNGYDENGLLQITSAVTLEDNKPPRNQSPPKSSEDYDGTHVIRWEHVNFPADGNYTIDVQVDDRVKLFIGNRDGNGKMMIGNGLRDIQKGGDEVIIEKNGFGPGRTGNQRATGKSTYTRFFKKGQYRIRAELTQVPGAPLNAGNPMYLAMSIKVATTSVRVQSKKSWYDNPMGVALTIQAPLPPIPQEPPIAQDGPCPPSPFWTTRSPNGKEKWWPVTFNPTAWSKFTNRYAISPIPPFGFDGTDGAGIKYSNEWDIVVEQRGYYGIKGTVDNGGAIYIDDQVVLSGGSGYEKSNPRLAGFNVNKPKNKKVLLEKGSHKIRVEVFNKPQFDTKIVNKQVFNTAEWIQKPDKSAQEISVDFDVYGQGSKKNTDLKFIFQEKGGDHSFVINNVDNAGGAGRTKKVRRKVKKNVDYKVTAIAGGSIKVPGKERSYPIELAAPGEKGRGRRAKIGSVENKKIKYLDEHGDDPNAQLSIDSTSPGVSAKFSADGSQLEVKGNGDVTLKFKWDDNPNSAGLAVGELRVGGKTFKQKGEKGEERKTITAGGSGGTERKNITKNVPIKFNNLNPSNNPIEVSGNNRRNKNDALKLRDGSGGDTNAKIVIEDVKGGTAQFSNDGRSLVCTGSVAVRIRFEWDDDPNNSGVALDSFEIGGKVWRRRREEGEKIQTVTIDATEAVASQPEFSKLVPEQGTSKVFGRGKKGTESQVAGNVIFADIIGSANDNDDMQIRCSAGTFTPSNKRKGVKGTSGQGTQRRNTWDLSFRLDDATTEVANPITEKNGVTYEGPLLAHYVNDEEGKPALSPFFDEGINEREEIQGRTWNMKWNNVDFPIDGRYIIRALADDKVTVKIDGVEITTVTIAQGRIPGAERGQLGGSNRKLVHREVAFTTTAGKKSVELELTNVRITLSGGRGLSSFRENPTYASVQVFARDTTKVQGDRPWTSNPVGISAVMTPPPCRKVVGGTGVVTKIIPTTPGNGYKTIDPPEAGTGTYPVVPVLTGITVIDGGINHNCGVDKIELVPSYGVELDYTCDSFGRIRTIIPRIGRDGGPPLPPIITRKPEVRITTSTGTGIVAVPEITPVVIPENALEDQSIIQVTDLVGLKQTGYANGKPYYGSVFYKDGIRYAGVYETIGALIQVYDTLQESIDAEIVTAPSAILRQGTDVTSNDPRLNIPGTPENLS